MPKDAEQIEVGRLVTIQELADLCGMSRETVKVRLRDVLPSERGSGPRPSKYNSLIALPMVYECIPK